MRHGDTVLELLESSGLKLRNLLFKMTLSEDTADDLMQELFLRLSRSPGFARSDNGFAYAWRSAVNLGIEHLRKRRSSAAYREQTGESPPAESPLDRLVQDERTADLLAAVGTLKRPGRDIVIMRYLEQREYAEIALLLGKRENYIRSQLSKSLTQLRAKLNGQFSKPE